MDITSDMISEFKRKANREKARDEDVVQLLTVCNGDVDKAVDLILKA